MTRHEFIHNLAMAFKKKIDGRPTPFGVNNTQQTSIDVHVRAGSNQNPKDIATYDFVYILGGMTQQIFPGVDTHVDELDVTAMGREFRVFIDPEGKLWPLND